jgi:hypothetical protein
MLNHTIGLKDDFRPTLSLLLHNIDRAIKRKETQEKNKLTLSFAKDAREKFNGPIKIPNKEQRPPLSQTHKMCRWESFGTNTHSVPLSSCSCRVHLCATVDTNRLT